jgi:hypothetical protein
VEFRKSAMNRNQRTASQWHELEVKLRLKMHEIRLSPNWIKDRIRLQR